MFLFCKDFYICAYFKFEEIFAKGRLNNIPDKRIKLQCS